MLKEELGQTRARIEVPMQNYEKYPPICEQEMRLLDERHLHRKGRDCGCRERVLPVLCYSRQISILFLAVLSR